MLFALASGAFVANGLSYYSMQAHLAGNLLFVALLIKPSPYRALGAGLVGSLALMLHNPVPTRIICGPLDRGVGACSAIGAEYLLPLIVGYLPGLVIVLLWLGLRSELDAG